MESVKYNENDYFIKIRHERPTKKLGMNTVLETKGGKTIAFIKLSETDSIKAESICSNKDTFNKKQGRTIAIGRLKKKLCIK